jgi:DNA-binding MarR family transcriptional regulator
VADIVDANLAEAWGKLLPLLLGRRNAFFVTLTELGLTPPHGFSLMSLADGPSRMRDLAEAMNCDASYVTAVVDRLQELGLAKRQESASDRRVREVDLTAKGRRVVARLEALFNDPPADLEVLSATDRAALARILRKLPVIAVAPWHGIGRRA